MAHWRDHGIGNMAGSDDRPFGEWTLLEQLASAAEGKVYGMSPDDLAQAAFDEIQRLRAIIDRDIETLTIIAGDADRLIALHAATRLSNIGAETK